MLHTTELATSSRHLMRHLGLRRVAPSKLTVERRKCGEGFAYYVDDKLVRNQVLLKRFRSLAVPPAYHEVRFAVDPRAHIQAIGRDDAGRLQYRYHPHWVQLRESEKSQRLISLVAALPRLRKAVSDVLAIGEPTREFALAAVIELISLSAIRPGNEEYVRRNGSRGASTLLKSNVRISGDQVTLMFRGKSGKDIRKEVTASRLAKAIAVLRTLSGPRLFQYRDETGAIYAVSAGQVNSYLRELAQVDITLKDFRTLCASASVLEVLAKNAPAEKAYNRHKQVVEAVRQAASELVNTPSVARKSYVHEAVVSAFEGDGVEKFARMLKRCRSARQREKLLAAIVTAAIA